MALINHCSICGLKTNVYQCSNEDCKKLVCLDCSQDYIMPLMEYFMNEPFPILKCPVCGNDLVKQKER